MEHIHSCSYYCDRPECVKSQRDELRAENAQLREQLEAVTKERDALISEMRADPNDYPNLLRINREHAEYCDRQLTAAMKEREHWETTCHAQWDNHQAEIAAVKEQLAACQRDAERYRWLVGKSDNADLGYRWDVCYDKWDGSDGAEGFGKVIDAAIDAQKGAAR